MALRERIYAYAAKRGLRGITTDEVQVGIHLEVHQSMSPRVSELCRDGLLVRTGEVRKTRNGCNANVLVTDVIAQSKPGVA